MAPAWGGVLGGALTEAANAYLRTVIDEPYERIRKRKAELELERLESQIESDRALAKYRLAGGGRGGSNRLYRTPAGLVRDNLETGVPELVYPFPAGAGKTLSPQQQADEVAFRGLEQKLGKPRNQITGIDILYGDNEVRDLWDYLRRNPDIIMTPGGFVRRGDVRAAQDPAGAAPPTAVPPTTTPPPTAAPPTAAPPTVTPAPPPGISAPPPRDVKPPPPGQPRPATRRPPRGGPPGLSEAGIKAYVDHYQALTDAEMQTELDRLTKEQAETPSPIILAKLEAIKRIQAARKQQAAPGPPAAAPPPSTPPPGAADAGAGTPPSTTRQPGTVPTVETDAQRRARELKEAKEQRDREDQAMQRRDKERQELELERRNRLELSGGPPTKDQERVTLELFQKGQVKEQYYSENSPEDRARVNRTIMEPKIRKEEQGWRKLAQPHLDELRALDTTQDLTTRIIPLIQSGNLGFPGKAQAAFEWFKSLLPGQKNAYYRRAEQQLREAGVTGPLSKAAIEAQIVGTVETNDANVRKEMGGIAGRARIQTLSSILMYAHALANKRITGGANRGIIKPDMEEAEKLFNTDLFFSNPNQLMSNLQELQGVIQRARSHIEETVRQYYIDPTTGKFLPGMEAAGGPPGVSGGTLTLTPEQIEQLQKGP